MTLDQLLFFLVLLAIPLLQGLVTAMRGRRDTARPGATEAAAAGRVTAGQPVDSAGHHRAAFEGPTAPPLVSPPVPEEVTGSARREVVARPIPRRAPVRDGRSGLDLPAKQRGAIPNAIRASAPRRRLALSGEDLRIALVHMVILGPCRAVEPGDPSQVA